MKKVLITGISGFAGSFLAEHLFSQNKYEIVGTYHSEESLKKIPQLQDTIQLIRVDFLDSLLVDDLIKATKPDIIFHLAAQTSTAESFQDPKGTIYTNIQGQLNLLEAVRKEELLQTRILIVASADMYGLVMSDDLPIDETVSFRPVSPYAVSKITQDYLGFQYNIAYKLQIIRARPFNHIGPRQQAKFVLPQFAKQIAEIEKGIKDPILGVGNLSAKRDFSDVRDIVKAYDLLIQKGKVGEAYNIGSGRSIAISELLEKLLTLSKKQITVKVDQSLFRPIDIPEIICDNKKITTETSWQPTIPLERTLGDTLDYWRSLV